MKRAIFLDRDGVINVDTPYVYKLKDFIFNPCLQLLKLCIREDQWLLLLQLTGNREFIHYVYKVAEKFIDNKLKELNLCH